MARSGLPAFPAGRLRRATQRADLSYGVYIYGWPIQQVLLLFVPWIAPWQLTLTALPLAAVCALL